ncbi:hypothetical protein FQZ97_854730 [compost metagenome]
MHHAQLLEVEGLGDHRDEVLLFAADVDAVGAAFIGAQHEGHDFLDHFREDGDQVAVAEGEHGVQVHGGAGLRQASDYHLLHGAFGEQRLRQLADGLAGSALAHADQHHTVADGHHVAPFQGGHAVVLVRVAIPDLELGLGEGRMELVDGAGQ